MAESSLLEVADEPSGAGFGPTASAHAAPLGTEATWAYVGPHEPLELEADRALDLADAGAGEALAPGDGSLAGDFTGVELAPPLDCLAERLDYGGRPGLLWRLGRLGSTLALGDGTDYLAGGHAARQDADIAILERSVRPERDLDGLFAEFDRTLDVVGG